MSGVREIIDGVDRSKIYGRVLWNDINHPAASLSLGATAPDSINILASGNIKSRGFDGNVTAESLHGSAEILHGWLEESDIHIHAHWMPTTANAGDVQWNLEYSWQNIDGTFPNPTTISVVDTASGTAWDHLFAPFPAISGTGKGINSALVYRFYRDPILVGDTYPNDAALIQIGIHYQIDVYGSRDIAVK
jgi:hypothetical protein